MSDTPRISFVAGSRNDDRGGDIGQAQRRIWSVHLQAGEALQPRKVDQCYHGTACKTFQKAI